MIRNDIHKLFCEVKVLPDNIIPISICAKAPDWYKGLQYKKLAPKYDFFMKWKETHDNDYYIKCFREQVLNQLTINTFLIETEELLLIKGDYSGKDFCLVCYEKPDYFCHRHLVAQWLNENGFKCVEWE